MSVRFMLDTATAGCAIKGSAPALDARLKAVDVSQVCISAVTRAELRLGVRGIPKAGQLTAKIDGFLNGIQTMPWDGSAADHVAEVRAGLEKSDAPIGTVDAMIAAHAKALGAVLVTTNVKQFRLVKGLTVVNWTV